MWPRFAPRLLTLLALMMNARARKRDAVAEVRQLAEALGSPVPRSKTDLTVAEFAALHREVKGHCLTPEQHAALDRAWKRYKGEPVEEKVEAGGAAGSDAAAATGEETRSRMEPFRLRGFSCRGCSSCGSATARPG